MEKFVVKQRYLSGKGKKQWQSGDEVTERDFPENFDQLISEGRIVPKNETQEKTDKVEKIKETSTETESEDKINLDNDNPMGEPLFMIGDRKVYSDEDVVKKEICKELDKIEDLEYKSSDNKAKLWDLLIANL
jgi:hypothetical protein